MPIDTTFLEQYGFSHCNVFERPVRSKLRSPHLGIFTDGCASSPPYARYLACIMQYLGPVEKDLILFIFTVQS